MIPTYKILNRIDRIDSGIFFELTAALVTRGNNQKIVKKKYARLGVVRVVNDWNSFPAEVIESQQINSFKSRFDTFWRPERYNLL